MKSFLILLSLISLIFLDACQTKEVAECHELSEYLEKKHPDIVSEQLILIASDKYCNPCVEYAIYKLFQYETRDIKIVLCGNDFEKSILDLIEDLPSNVNLSFDKERVAEKYMSLAKPRLVYTDEGKCLDSYKLTNEVVDQLYPY